ncbi:hypothetical protein ACWOFR_14830 [Carnobacterium gallinarum]|nr:hypothetical protein [Carnobacterium gallinarum]
MGHIDMYENAEINLHELKNYLWNLTAAEIHYEIGFELWEFYVNFKEL